MRKFNQEELVEKIRSERRHMTELYDEINQLKQENANLKEYVKSLKDECISCPENKKNVKQAKIDVLNELKDKMFEREYMGVKYKERIFYESEIDDMIAEVQNGEDKS